MNKFVFISTNSIKEYYNFLLNKQKSHKFIVDTVKLSGLFVFLSLCGFIYLRFVSLASTEGYFLRKANNELAAMQFKQEIVKTEILEQTQRNREKMYGNNQTKKIIEIRPEIVQIPNKTELSYK
ncbi:MAG TPA: hypothetical protein PK674_01740 [Candidatus Absconditabacterales bacterium]|nr:hypothetical protein [Candidatus Absconditabacterales bacterium]HOQ78708.1 hypothetical protein [Candidatus Absconditabacterales bacterium]HPK27722.1 hypothetical protein [Candidatus Absconditabacterales bacterium]